MEHLSHPRTKRIGIGDQIIKRWSYVTRRQSVIGIGILEAIDGMIAMIIAAPCKVL